MRYPFKTSAPAVDVVGAFVSTASNDIANRRTAPHRDGALSELRLGPGRPAVRGFLFRRRIDLAHHYHVSLRSGHPEFLSGRLHRFVLAFGLDHTEVLVLVTS